MKNEIEILSVLSHPNIIAYYTHFFGEKDIFIEMEYANGDISYKDEAALSSAFQEEVYTQR